MKYYQVTLLATSANASQWPQSELPEIIFAGRSNAGKSSLINALVNRKNAAYAGKTPGKTQLLNFFSVDDEVVFADAPGYGYAKGGTDSTVRFARLIDPYFRNRRQLKALLIVLDIRRVPNEDDMHMVDYARNAHLPVIAACTKCDKLSRMRQNAQIDIICRTLNISRQSAVPVSCVNRDGIEILWEKIRNIYEKKEQA
ncbi:MAG: ribosome biogenesis GTP-binding protein YihA/YsxC [Solobacterium sp.]|nr:ribosome biogenesis GTP-binding protein YihA/YsxC [Solobacterium sp.]